MEQLPLFVFGTLRFGQCNHCLLDGKYSRRATARLRGFSRIHSLMIVPRLDGRVAGELYDLHPTTYRRTLADCDELEGIACESVAGEHYRRMRVVVTVDDAEVLAWAYVHRDTPDDWPQEIASRRA